ncbi:EamA family transporter [Conexibacter sp. W3-3-2]|nr:EamA family transporter [Conexibacter sp. W3-3-2]
MTGVPRTDRLALAAAAVTVLLWASAFVGIRAAAEDLTAGPLALGRLLVASLVLTLVVLWRGEAGLPERRDLPAIALCGVVWFGLYNVALNQGERSVDAGTAAMLVNLGPLLIALLAGAVLGEGFPRALLLGCAVAFAGTVVIGAGSTASRHADLAGVALCVGAAVAYAVGVTLQKPLLARTSALRITWLACLTGTVVLLPFSAVLVRETGDADAGALAWTVYLGIFPTAVAFTTWAFALGRTTAGRMGATTYLVPPLAVLLGWLLLDEVPATIALAGGALCLAGVALARRGSGPPAAAGTAAAATSPVAAARSAPPAAS